MVAELAFSNLCSIDALPLPARPFLFLLLEIGKDVSDAFFGNVHLVSPLLL